MIAIVNPDKPFLSGWNRRKRFAVNATYSDRDRIIDLNVHSGSGTDDSDDVYLGGNVRSDWGDLRITRSDGLTRIPYAILRDDGAGNIIIAVRVVVVNGDNHYYIYWDGPAADVYKIMNTTDIHYDPDGASGGASEQDRVNSLTYITNMKTRSGTYSPDLVVICGDMMGAQDSDPATQLSWATSVLDQFTTGTTGTLKRGVAMGNHDFEFVTDTNMRALIDDYESWMESGAFYGEFHETADFVFVSLDSNYNPTGEAHMSAAHQGFGYVNSAQLTWLAAYLAAAVKEVIVFIHHPCGEFDTEQFTLTKDIYHTRNREAVRTLLEQSQKVVAVFHGHMHFQRTDIIRGIPYIAIANLTTDGSFGEVPTSSVAGRWALIDVDKSSRMIRVRFEGLISGTTTVIYDQYVPFGKTIFSDDISNDPEEVFKMGYGTQYGKSSYLRDPCQMYVENDDYLWKYPVNLQTPDDAPLFRDSIKIVGRTFTPDFGRTRWYFPFTGEPMILEFWIMFRDDTYEVGIKIGGLDVTNNPQIYVAFNDDSSIESITGLPTPATITNLGTYSAATWYKLEFFISLSGSAGGSWDLFINNVDTGNPNDFWAPNGAHGLFRTLEIVTEVSHFWVSGLNVRPWHAPRPTMNGFDDEETA